MTEAQAAPPANYYARRERQERAVAERSTNEIARRIHLDLAARYAALAGR